MQKENLKKLNEELFKAVDDLNFDLVLHALNKGAQVNALDSNGQTALLKALKYENFKIAKALIRYGADARIVDNEGVSCAKVLKEKILKEKVLKGNDPLKVEVLKGYLQLIDSLVYYGPEVKKGLWDRLSQKELDENFYQALQEKRLQKAEDLLKQGAFLYGLKKEDVLKIDDKQVIDFIDEKIKANQKLFKAIKENDALKIWDLSLTDKFARGMNEEGVPALVMAAKEGAQQAFLMLANNFEVDVNQPDQTGQTALMWAAKKNDAEMIEWLLYMGAEPSLVDHQGKEAIIYAVENKGFEAMQKLMNFEEMDMIQKAIQKAKEVDAPHILSFLTNELFLKEGALKVNTQKVLNGNKTRDYQREG